MFELFNNLYLYLKSIQYKYNDLNFCDLLNELCVSMISKTNLLYNNEIIVNIIYLTKSIIPTIRFSKSNKFQAYITTIKKIAELRIINESPIKMFNSKIIVLFAEFKLIKLGDIYLDNVIIKYKKERVLSANDYIELACSFGLFNVEKRRKYMKLALEKYLINKPKYSLELADYYSKPGPHCLSEIYRYLGEYEKALNCALKSLEIREKLAPTDYENLLPTIYRIASAYENLNDEKKHNEYLFRALEIKERENFSNLDLAEEYWSLSHSSCVNSIDLLYKSWHYIKAYKNNVTKDNYQYFRRIYSQTMTAFAVKKHYKEALECALDNFETCYLYFFNDEHQFYISYNDIAHFNKKIGNYTQAIYYYELSIKALKDSGDPYSILSKQYANLANIYDIIKDYYNAIINLEKAITLFDDNHNPKKELQIYYFCIAEFYEKINNPTKALQNYKLSYNLNENPIYKEDYESRIKRLSETLL